MDDKKIIINVGRQLGSGGRIIASMLAKDFGCKFYDKELLNLAAKESGFCENFSNRTTNRRVFSNRSSTHTCPSSQAQVSTTTGCLRRVCSSFRAMQYARRRRKVRVSS